MIYWIIMVLHDIVAITEIIAGKIIQSPFQCQAIIRTNVTLSSIGFLRTKILIKWKGFLWECPYNNSVCTISAFNRHNADYKKLYMFL